MNFRILILLLLFSLVKIFSQEFSLDESVNMEMNESIEFIGSWQTNGQVNSVFVTGNIAYVGNENKVDIVDFTIPNSPELLGQAKLNTSFKCQDIVGILTKILVANNQTIYLFDVSDPTNPDSIGSINLNSLITDIFIEDNTLYAIASYDFFILEINDDNSISIAGKLSLPESSLGLTRFDIEKDLAFVASWDGGIYIIDISNSLEPKLHGRFLENSNLIYVNKSFGYAADFQTLYILDITDTVLPSINLSTQIFGTPHDIYADENYVYFLIDNKLEIFNSDLEHITSYLLNDNSQRLYSTNGLIFIANNAEGLQILKFSDPSSVLENNNKFANFKLEQNYPNPFNSNTIINFQILTNCNVELDVYDILGNKVEKLLNEYKTAGSYKFEFKSNKLASGTYIYKLKTSTGFTNSKKLILQK